MSSSPDSGHCLIGWSLKKMAVKGT